MRISLAFLLLILVSPAVALGQDGGPDRDAVERARSHFNSGIQYYDDQRYEDAAREFEEAYRLTQHPDVLYNLAQSYDRLERYDEAITEYRRYLAEAGNDSPERDRVERRVRELETLRDARETGDTGDAQDGATDQSMVAPLPEEEAGGGLGALPFITMGVGAASIVAALIFGVTASGIHSDLEADCNPDGTCDFDPSDRASEGSTFATLADVFGIVGGVILGAGIVLLAVDLSSGSGESDDGASAALEITTGPTPLGAGARVRF